LPTKLENCPSLFFQKTSFDGCRELKQQRQAAFAEIKRASQNIHSRFIGLWKANKGGGRRGQH
jgi:hypothetical protein